MRRAGSRWESRTRDSRGLRDQQAGDALCGGAVEVPVGQVAGGAELLRMPVVRAGVVGVRAQGFDDRPHGGLAALEGLSHPVPPVAEDEAVPDPRRGVDDDGLTARSRPDARGGDLRGLGAGEHQLVQGQEGRCGGRSACQVSQAAFVRASLRLPLVGGEPPRGRGHGSTHSRVSSRRRPVWGCRCHPPGSRSSEGSHRSAARRAASTLP